MNLFENKMALLIANGQKTKNKKKKNPQNEVETFVYNVPQR